jgi:hypothetical protein
MCSQFNWDGGDCGWVDTGDTGVFSANPSPPADAPKDEEPWFLPDSDTAEWVIEAPR